MHTITCSTSGTGRDGMEWTAEGHTGFPGLWDELQEMAFPAEYSEN